MIDRNNSNVFICYARKDQDKSDWLGRLETHLKAYSMDGALDYWDDRRLKDTPGANWRTAIENAIERCEVAILLIGPAFFASQFVQEVELPRLLRLAVARGCRIMPLITGYSRYENSELEPLFSFNPASKPLIEMTYAEQEKTLSEFSYLVAKAVSAMGEPPADRGRVESDLMSVISRMGIVDGAARLEESPFQLKWVFGTCQRSLLFLGNLGRKWIGSDSQEAAFKDFLRQMNVTYIRNRNRHPQSTRGQVRFLLMDPTSEAFREQQLASSQISQPIRTDSIERFVRLARDTDTYPCFQLRLYSWVPCFRLVFVDETELVFAPYRFYGNRVFSEQFGFESPQLKIKRDSQAPWSLYDAFEQHFEQLWNSATTIDGRNWNGVP